MSKKIAVFPGSFDPITIGHYNLVKRATTLFDEVIVAVGINSTKSYLFSLEERFKMVHAAFEEMPAVRIESFEGLTVEFCKSHNAQYILRGVRNSMDFEFEKNIAQMNKAMEDSIETVVLVTDPDLSAVSSTIVREIIKNGGEVAQFLPPNVTI